MTHHLTQFDLLVAYSIKRVLIKIYQGLLQFTFATRGNRRTLKNTSLACLKKIVAYFLNELYVFFKNQFIKLNTTINERIEIQLYICIFEIYFD